MKITKITSKFGVMSLEFVERQQIEEEQTTVVTSQKYEHLAHNDFREAIEMLTPFLCDLTDQVPIGTKKDLKKVAMVQQVRDSLKDYTVTGIVIGGEEFSRHVTLIGHRTLRSNKVLNIVSPKQKLFDDNDKYEFGEQLDQLINIVIKEAELYMGGKAAPSPQLTIEDMQEEEEAA